MLDVDSLYTAASENGTWESEFSPGGITFRL